FLCRSEPATVYAVSNDAGNRSTLNYSRSKIAGTFGWQNPRGAESKTKNEAGDFPQPATKAVSQMRAAAIPEAKPEATPFSDAKSRANIEPPIAVQPAPAAMPGLSGYDLKTKNAPQPLANTGEKNESLTPGLPGPPTIAPAPGAMSN